MLPTHRTQRGWRYVWSTKKSQPGIYRETNTPPVEIRTTETKPLLSSWAEPFDRAGDEAIMKEYGAAIDARWVMQMAWIHQDKSEQWAPKPSDPVCLQAKDVAQGSTDPNADGSRSRRGAKVSAIWGAAMAVMLLAFV